MVRRAQPVRVLVVDDSMIFRLLLVRALRADGGIEVIGEAGSGEEARAFVERMRPDVITLDLEMPGEGGMAFLRDVVAPRGIPTIVVSSLTQRGARRSIEALEAGAVDVMAKPEGTAPGQPDEDGLSDIGLRIRAVSRARLGLAAGGAQTVPVAGVAPGATAAHRLAVPGGPGGDDAAAEAQAPASAEAPRHGPGADGIILLGASTGGVQALGSVLQAMPPDCPPVLIVQHMPEGFTHAFARRLDEACRPDVSEALDGDAVAPGRVLIAPGGSRHMELRAGPMRQLSVALVAGEPVSFSRPSVDALFLSAARIAAPRVTAALLTGMGADGAAGMVALRKGGARTFVQDEASALIWGMPGQAWRMGGASEQLPLGEVAARLLAPFGMKSATPI